MTTNGKGDPEDGRCGQVTTTDGTGSAPGPGRTGEVDEFDPPEAARRDGDPGRLASALSAVQGIVDVRERTATARSRADRISAAVLGLGYAVLALGCASAAEVPTLRQALLLATLTALYVVAHRTEFVAAGGSTVPTEPVLVGLLLLTPLPLVPLAVLIALQIGGAGLQEAGSRATNLLARMISGWHCLGPVAVLAAWPVDEPRLGAWPVYLLALLAQFTADAASAVLRCAALGVPPSRLVAPLRWTFAVDALLAPLGLCVVVAAGDSPGVVVLLAVPIGLVRLLARDRTEQLAKALSGLPLVVAHRLAPAGSVGPASPAGQEASATLIHGWAVQA